MARAGLSEVADSAAFFHALFRNRVRFCKMSVWAAAWQRLVDGKQSTRAARRIVVVGAGAEWRNEPE